MQSTQPWRECSALLLVRRQQPRPLTLQTTSGVRLPGLRWVGTTQELIKQNRC